MKIISISDIHLDLKTFGVPNPETGINSRSLDGLNGLKQVVNFAINKKNKIDYILMSGDIFDSKFPTQNVIYEFYKLIKQLSDSHVITYILSGNHDNSKMETRRTALDLANIVNLPNIYMTRGDEYLDLDNLQIVSPNYWDTVEETDEILAKLTKKVDFSRPAILVAHVEVPYPGSYGAYTDALDEILPLEVLQKYNKYLFCQLGHIHKPMTLSEKPFIFYTGSLVRCSFTEEEDPKFFRVIEIENNKLVDIKNIPIDCLKMKTFRGNMTSIKDSLEKNTPEDWQDTIVRLIIDITEEPLDESFLKNMFAQSFKYIVKTEKAKVQHQQIEVKQDLLSLRDYGNLYFETNPRKEELLTLMSEFEQMDEAGQK